MITVQDIRKAVRDLGLGGRPLCVHSSLRSFGWVQQGASTVITGLLAEGCTIMVTTFSYSFVVPPPVDMQPERNGWNYETFKGPIVGIGKVFTPDSLEIDRDDIGAIPTALVEMPSRIRGNHPLDSFTAVGPLAHQLISPQEPLNPYAPLRVLAETNGSVILMGVGLDKMTLLHYAEQLAGRHLFIRWANGFDRQPMAVEAGGCSDGFTNFEPHLSVVRKEKKVGKSTWAIFPANAVLNIAAKAIQNNPGLTHCGDLRCERCNDAVIGGPVILRG